MVIPTSFSQIRYYLRCPRDYQFRESFGFSPSIPDMFGFGMTVHTAIEKLHERYRTRPPTPDEAEETAREVFHLKHVPQSRNPESNPGPYERAQDSAGGIARQYAEDYGTDFLRSRNVEARFEIPVEHAVISGSIDLLLREDDAGHILEAEVIDFKALEEEKDAQGQSALDWTEFALQVQLYARAANQILGENAKTGSVHLLKDNTRVQVPVSDDAVDAAIRNVEWAVAGILASDFPMRPHRKKCERCDFKGLCPKEPQDFRADAGTPPAVHLPGEGRTQLVLAFSQSEDD
jgi:DNA helicase-2/ATP-dependent DNA helicase PcrA